MIPTTPIALRFHALFNRRPATAWSEKEVKAYKEMIKANVSTISEDLTVIEGYYKSERAKGDKGIHRRDLLTLLNNFQGELDRAHAWRLRKKQRDYDRYAFRQSGGNGEKPLSDEEFKKAGEIARTELARFRNSLRSPEQVCPREPFASTLSGEQKEML